jgi:excisionase family DNA binding protein
MRAKGFLLCTEVAELVGIHKTTVYRWVRDGRVRAKDFSGAYYVEWGSVLEHLGEVADVLGLRQRGPTVTEPQGPIAEAAR